MWKTLARCDSCPADSKDFKGVIVKSCTAGEDKRRFGSSKKRRRSFRTCPSLSISSCEDIWFTRNGMPRYKSTLDSTLTVFRVIISLSWWMPSSTQHESIETLYTIKWHLLEASIVAIPSGGWKWWPTQWHGLINRECMACLENLALRVLEHQEGHSRYSSCECRG